MLKHRVQNIPGPDVLPGNGNYSGIHPGQDAGYSGTQHEQYSDYFPPSEPNDNAQYYTQQPVTHPSTQRYYGEQYPHKPVSQSASQEYQEHNSSPANTSINDACASSYEGQLPQNSTQEYVPHSNSSVQDSNEGVRLITEKYDSLNKLSMPVSPHKSPRGSPSSDGCRFSFTDMVMSQKFREGVTEQDLLQVDTFYHSHKTEVYVCACLANMYIGSAKSVLNNDQWTFSCTGIPLLLLDTGEHHRERKLYFLLAEKGTGFTIWRDVIDNLTGYRTPNSNFHTMYTSKDHTKLAGFSFDDAGAAAEFYGHVQKLTADPDDELLKIGKSKKKKSIKIKKKTVKLPKKTEISQPCCFVHVTKLDRPIGDESEISVPNNKSSNPNEISAPFNFQHVTGSAGIGSDVISVSNMIGSKLTLTSASSVDSDLSDDRGSARTGN